MKKILLILFGLIIGLSLYGCQDRKIKYDENDCFVAFYVGNQEKTPLLQKLQKGSKITEPKLKTKSGEIIGWYYEVSFDSENNMVFDDKYRWDFDNDQVKNHLTLYAKFVKRVLNINYHLDSESIFKKTGDANQTNLDPKYLTFYYSSGVNNLPEVVKTGHSFFGFYTKPLAEMDQTKEFPFKSIKAFDEIIGEENTLDLYPILKPKEITFIFYSKSGNAPRNTKKDFGSEYEFEKLPDYNGKKFLGWYTQASKPELQIQVPLKGTWLGYPYYDENNVKQYNTTGIQFKLIAKFED